MFLSAILLGLLGSLHCVGMCGPIAFMLPIDRKNRLKGFLQLLSYHLGRLFTYSLIGLLFGFLGKGFYLFGFQQQISIIAGVSMILIIVFPKFFNKINFSKSINSFIFRVKNALGEALKKKGNDTFFTIGFLNGFLPCGLVYMAVFGAVATATPLEGSLYMFLFGFGTIPLMTSVVYLGNFTKGTLRVKIQHAIPYLVILVGVLFVLRGLGLGIPYVSPKPIVELVSSTNACH
ncbi:sulfite exporter TauE/SafE family protein [Polaribacter tangerinus]|uniref:sulfite exporter TauE/SafE family protein n=1 Tax=Polaribacter tangerinus TaxID=1920034 RepID=UPI000B4B0ED5|nr:sulfite exporter TauE/SafE family protein [Polaribacter tangerinus]